MQISDLCGVNKEVTYLARSRNGTEHCAIAIGRISLDGDINIEILDYCLVEELGGAVGKETVVIPKDIAFSVLNLCKKNKYIPIIIHTHEYSGGDVSLSILDKKYIDSFSKLAFKIGGIPFCLFAVTDSKTIQYCMEDIAKMEHVVWEEVVFV